jgi:integrase
MGQIIARAPKGQLPCRKWLVKEFVRSEVVGGKRRKKYVSRMVEGTYASARRALAALRVEVSTRSFIPPNTQTLAEYVDWWLSDVVGARSERGTVGSYRDRIRSLLVVTGHLRLDRLTAPILQHALNHLASERRWSRRTTRYTKTILGMALNEAVRQGLLRANPASALVLPRPTQTAEVRLAPDATPSNGGGATRVWTGEQVSLFLQNTKASEWYPVWNLLLNTGLRPGEACGLQWTDLRGTDLHIERAVKSDWNKGWLLGATKTRGSIRTISLPRSTLCILREYRNGQLSGFIFNPDRFKKLRRQYPFLQPDSMGGAWKRDVKRSGLPPIALYSTRHTHATLLLSLEVPIKVVSERLGHSGVQITMDTYQHVLPHMQEEVASKLNAALG